MTRHRIVIVGAPASGRTWLAERIESLTGIPRLGDAGGATAREWVAVADGLEDTEALLGEADLVVVVEAPLLLRWVRLLPGIRAAWRRRDPGQSLAATARWPGVEPARLGPRLEAWGGDVMRCRSSEDVRAVLERVFGFEAG